MCLGIPGQVLETRRDEHGVLLGRVAFGGVARLVCLDCVPDAAAGDFVLVHVGFALTKLDAEEARRIFEMLEELDELLEAER
jgi:hydrogenase expression/formation protein HypC